MSLLRLYTRVLQLLGNEARLGWILAFVNLLLAGAQFAEPVLFGKIVDVLSGKPQIGPLGPNAPCAARGGARRVGGLSPFPRSWAAPGPPSARKRWRTASVRRC